MAESKHYSIEQKSDGLYLLVIEPLRNAMALGAELDRMQLEVEAELFTTILSAQAQDEILISAEYDIEDVVIEISPDKMHATMEVKPIPGRSTTIEELAEALVREGVLYGENQAALREAYQNPGQKIIVARGTKPITGGDARIIMHYQEPKMKPILCEDGRVDYYELGKILPINAGDVIATHIPATEGTEGFNVLGDILPAKPGRAAKFPIGKGVIVAEDKAIAEFDGALSWINNKVLVVKILTINGNVDFSTGNIDFPGKVLITGSVPEGFRVMADDDIDVRGGVDDAEIISRRGSVFVQKGIIGRGKAFVKAQKNVEARFIQEAVVEAGQNIVVSEYVLRCDIKAGDSVLIQGRKGKIMGNNTISAKTKIKAARIQNSQGLHLVVEGIQRQDYYDRVKELNLLITNKENNIRDLTTQIRRLKDRTDDPLRIVSLQSLLPEYMGSYQELEEMIAERALLVSILKNTRGEGMIEIGAGLEEGMRLSIKNESINVTDNMQHLSMYFDPEEKRIVMVKARN